MSIYETPVKSKALSQFAAIPSNDEPTQLICNFKVEKKEKVYYNSTMKEQTDKDNIFKEVRMRAIRNAYIPESIRRKYSVTVNEATGKIVIGKRPDKK